MLVGRQVGWALSKSVLYRSPFAVSLVVAVAWGTGVGFSITGLIDWLRPGILSMWCFGFLLGAYVAIPNYGLFSESTIRDSELPRHLMIKIVPLLAFITTQLIERRLNSSTAGVLKAEVPHFRVGSLGPGLVFLEVVGALAIAGFFLVIFLDWIRRRHPRWRNISAFIVAVGSAYALGFAADLIISALSGAIPRQNVILPVLTWTGIGLACYSLATSTANSNRAIYIPFAINGGLAAVAALIGHVRNCFVALPLLFIALVAYKRDRNSPHKPYYAYDESSGFYRATGETSDSPHRKL